jgi:hypothetical protein
MYSMSANGDVYHMPTDGDVRHPSTDADVQRTSAVTYSAVTLNGTISSVHFVAKSMKYP